MKGLELREWRKLMGHTQQQAGDALGVTRATIQNWEYEATPIPASVDLACTQLLRQWKQRPEFGPVVLVYTNIPLPRTSDSSSQLPTLTCKWCVTNIDAFVKINELSGTPNFSNAMILDELGIAIWTGAELIGEFQGYQSTSAQLPR